MRVGDKVIVDRGGHKSIVEISRETKTCWAIRWNEHSESLFFKDGGRERGGSTYFCAYLRKISPNDLASLERLKLLQQVQAVTFNTLSATKLEAILAIVKGE